MPHRSLIENSPDDATPIVALDADALPAWLERADPALRRWVTATAFTAREETFSLIPDAEHGLGAVVAGIGDPDSPWALAHLATALPGGDYRLAADCPARLGTHAALGWALHGYHFGRYKTAERAPARLAIPSGADAADLEAQVFAVCLVRDLINTPAEDMGPESLADRATEIAQAHAAQTEIIRGAALLDAGYPAIHAVGRASARAPRLIDLRWGDPDAPRVTVIGKGVCFDSGGLDLKGAAGMRLMKKDMGGAAHALALADLIMKTALPIRLRVLIPAVENAVSGNALRPGDVIASRKGLSIEVDNTDAEGRLVLADALAEGGAERPDLIIDFATLTGAARVALGTELPALFCNDEPLAGSLLDAATAVHDPIWRLPLHRPYRKLLDSRVADIANAGSAPYGGAITAALFLSEFLPADVPWAHFDIMAWNSRARPGRPEGGEAMGLRAAFACLRRRYGSA